MDRPADVVFTEAQGKRKRDIAQTVAQTAVESLKEFPQYTISLADAMASSADLREALTRAEAHLTACTDWVRKHRAQLVEPGNCAFVAELYCRNLAVLQQMSDDKAEHKTDELAIACARTVHQNNIDDIEHRLDTRVLPLNRLPLFVNGVSRVTVSQRGLCVHIPHLHARFTIPQLLRELEVTHVNSSYMLASDESCVTQRRTATGDIMHVFALPKPCRQVAYCVNGPSLLMAGIIQDTLIIDEFSLQTGLLASSHERRIRRDCVVQSVAGNGAAVAVLCRRGARCLVRLYCSGKPAVSRWLPRPHGLASAVFLTEQNAVRVLTWDGNCSRLWEGNSDITERLVWTRPEQCRLFNGDIVFGEPDLTLVET